MKALWSMVFPRTCDGMKEKTLARLSRLYHRRNNKLRMEDINHIIAANGFVKHIGARTSEA
jgi:hypothetical protein